MNNGKVTGVNKDSEESLMQEVYKKLLGRLLHNELVPGNILNRKKIAEELNVSMAPVREAIMQLTIEGFVETLPRKGTIIKTFNREDIYGRFIMRDAIECEAARMYCGKPIKDNYEYLMKKASALDSLSGELLEIWQSDLLFHQDLIKLSGCNVLVVEFKRMMHLSTFYQINSFLTNDERQERQSHCDLIDTLTIENPDHAENVIRDHLKSGKRKFLY